MARDLERSSSQTLTSTTSPVSGGVMTLATWVLPELFANSDIFFCIGNASDHYIRLEFNSAGNVRFKIYDGGGDQADSTTTMTLNTWHHACGVINSTSDRAVFLDGGSKGTDTALNNPTSLDRICFGARYLSTIGQYADCRVAEAGIWDAALSDEEVASLAEGYAPFLIKPENLVAYWPLVRDEDQDIVGGYDLTANNAPTVTEHPPLIKYSHPVWTVVVPSGVTPPSVNIMDNLHTIDHGRAPGTLGLHAIESGAV